jgi:hypothetical protein
VTNPRWKLERAVVASELPGPARHVLLTLAVYADWPAGTTPAQHTPSLSTLAKATGLSRSTVALHLNTLETSGWVRRIRPTVARAWADKERTCYRLTVPGTSPGDGLVRETDQSDERTSPGDGPGLVREPDGTSPGAGHDPDLDQTIQTKEQHVAPKSTRGTRVPDDFAVTPPMRAWYREHTPGVDIAIETANFVDHWRAAAGAKATKADWTAAWRTWMRNAQKWKAERASNGHATTGANRHVDQLTPEQRAARNPFASATRASEVTPGRAR